MANKNKGVVIVLILGILAVVLLGPKIGLFSITGNEGMARSSPSVVDSGSTFDVQYSATSVSGKWAATVVETLSCPGMPDQVKQFVLISDEGTTKTISYTIPNQEGITCTLSGNYQYGNRTIYDFPTQTIQTRITVLPIILDSFDIELSGKTLYGDISWRGGESPYTITINNFGDGNGEGTGSITTKQYSFSHTYENSGTYNIDYCITDGNSLSQDYCSNEIVTITQVCNTDADTNCDGMVNRDELGSYISKWINGQVSRTALGSVIVAWASS